MSSKTFYAKFDSQAFLEKKYLTNLVYSKNIIRNNIDEKNKVQSIDNNSTITHFKNKTDSDVGSSLILKDFLFPIKAFMYLGVSLLFDSIMPFINISSAEFKKF